jgi:hypothetical protein
MELGGQRVPVIVVLVHLQGTSQRKRGKQEGARRAELLAGSRRVCVSQPTNHRLLHVTYRSFPGPPPPVTAPLAIRKNNRSNRAGFFRPGRFSFGN